MEEVVTRLLIARHPETEANLARRFIGTGESPYTERGRAQAEQLSACIAAWGPSVVRSSVRQRAIDAAHPAAERCGAEFVSDERLAEIDFGKAEGLTYDEARRAGVPMDFLGGPTTSMSPFEGGETWTSFSDRVELAISDALVPDGRIAIVTHGGVFRAMLVRLMHLPDDASWRFAIPPASIATLAVHDRTATLETFGTVPGKAPWEE